MSKRFDDGQIVEYDYLWEWQARESRTNAEKARPVCLAMVIADGRQGITHSDCPADIGDTAAS